MEPQVPIRIFCSQGARWPTKHRETLSLGSTSATKHRTSSSSHLCSTSAVQAQRDSVSWEHVGHQAQSIIIITSLTLGSTSAIQAQRDSVFWEHVGHQAKQQGKVDLFSHGELQVTWSSRSVWCVRQSGRPRSLGCPDELLHIKMLAKDVLLLIHPSRWSRREISPQLEAISAVRERKVSKPAMPA